MTHAVPAYADIVASMAMDEWSFQDLQAKGIKIDVYRQDNGVLSAELHIKTLQAADDKKNLSGVEISCPELQWDKLIVCNQGIAKVQSSFLGPQSLPFRFFWVSEKDFALHLSELKHAGSQTNARIWFHEGAIKVWSDSKGLKLDRSDPLKGWLTQDFGLSVTGDVDVAVQAVIKDSQPETLSANVRFKGLSYSDESGLQVAENADANLFADLSSGRKLLVKLNVLSGEAYSDPIYLDFSQSALTVEIETKLSKDWSAKRLTLSKLALSKRLNIKGKGRLTANRLCDGEFDIAIPDLSFAWQNFAQPFMLESSLAGVELGGTLNGGLVLNDCEVSELQATVSELKMQSAAYDLSVSGGEGQLSWSKNNDRKSSLRFSDLTLGNIPMQPSQIDFVTSGEVFSLSKPVRFALLGGEFDIHQLSNESKGSNHWQLSISASDLQLAQVSSALGWPPLDGRFGLDQATVTYSDGAISTEGRIRGHLFDGDIELYKLKLSDLDSVAPIMDAQLNLSGIDLSRFTRAFSFGRIDGRLDAKVKDIQLVGWQPNRFDALFETPEHNDDLPHRISQRAIDNLTALGNGVSGALSTSFLSIFKDFSYDKIQLSVQLEGNDAELGGLPHSSGGYYIVKGAGLPRIDVIGRNRHVGWRDLVSRLKSIRVESAVIE